MTSPSGVLPAFRDFAALIDSALNRNDIEFFRDRAQTEHVVCGPQDVARAGRTAACEREGQEYEGLGLSYWRSDESGRVPADWVLGMIHQLWEDAVPGGNDQYGGSEPEVYAIGETNIPGPTLASVLTAIIERPNDIKGSGPLRVVLVAHWRMAEGEWRFDGLLTAFVLGEDFLEPNGARGWMPTWERFQP